ncbi:MAG: ATP-binding cassette domain-containing protein [Alphaproteobacteria bacterium]|nr:ATP-binding cassette domain-containing protein [Alphaproteobacteria bacterium]
MSAPLLRVRDLCVSFPARRGRLPVRAVDHVGFDIAAGETLGLVGESGSGKTTTGRAILQLQPVNAGSVELLGQELVAMPSRPLRAMRRHMQLVQQNPYSSLHPRMTVASILAEPLRVHRSVPARAIPERVAELMTLVGMDPAVVQRYPHEFSGGQRQRIVIARALAVNPDFVVCDEPVSALDVRTQAQIVELLHDLQRRLGLSYLFIAHDLAVVRAMAHRVAVMFGGSIVELGPAARVYGQPAHPYTRSLLDAVPVPDPARQRARLLSAQVDLDFRGGAAAEAPSALHEVAPGHFVSRRFWPA